jgi:FkbH-like protein
MRLIQALNTLNGARDRTERREFDLLCGFQPLHLGTLLAAYLQQGELHARVVMREGQYGDLVGNIERATADPREAAALLIEWDDLDPRLGIRHAGSWSPDVLPDVLAGVERALGRIADALPALAQAERVALCLPTLPIPPLALTPTWQASEFELVLLALTASLGAEAARVPGIRVLNRQHLDEISPLPERRSARADLSTGFPYTQGYADRLARELSRLLAPPAPKKGLITDLDDTLWSGILGEVGVAGIAWDLDHKAQAHGVYQEVLTALAASGILVAAVSKNDPTLVTTAFERPDIRLSPSHVFPILASWGPKSEAVAEVLRLWNIGADSVVFIDDSQHELAEVERLFPEVECIRFPAGDPDGVLALLTVLRDRFGKERVLPEDVIRLDSLRRAAQFRESATKGGADADEFLSTLDARITVRVTRDPSPRAFELVNKTNQFNLNGERYTEAEWQSLLDAPDAFVLTVEYTDKFGQLGTIAAVTGQASGETVTVDRWVMSCRAFARRIEHTTLRLLLDEFGASAAVLDFRPTERNGPLRDFLSDFVELPAGATALRISRERFEAVCKPTYHEIEQVSAHEYARG